MKKSDNKTEAQPEEVKPEAAKADEVKSETSKPKKTTTSAKPAVAKADGAKSGTAKPKTTKKATAPAPAEEAKPVEEAKLAEEVKAEKPAEEVKAETAVAEVPAEEPKPEEKSDKKSFFSNKRNVAIVACAGAAVVALSVGLGLGLGLKSDDEAENTPFTAPTVVINESILSWSAVDDATNGYTIKFAETEKELKVTQISYDVLSDTSYLAEGTNSLSVKVNATDTYLASAYSNTVTYNYTISVQKFDAPTGLAVTDNTLSWTAVDGAVTYTVKINDDETTKVTTNSLDLATVTAKFIDGDNTIAVRVEAVGGKSASDYSNAITYNHVDTAAFEALVEAIDITAPDAKEKLAEAKTAYEALSDRAKEVAADAVAKLKEKDGNYFVALVDKIGEVTEDSGEVIETAVNYYETVLDKTAQNVVSAKAELDEKDEAYQHFYESYVAEFTAKVSAIVIEDNSRGDVIDTAKTAIGSAEEYYNAQTANVKSALAKLKITLDGKKASYDKAVKAELDGFMALVDEALEIIKAQSSLTALTEKQTAIPKYYGELSEVNQATVDADAELTANIASIATAIENWNTAISDAVTEMTVTASGDDEADIVSANTALTKFENYPDFIKENESVAVAKEATEEVLATAKGNVEKKIDDLQADTEAALAKTEPNETNFAALEAQKAAIEGVDGAYASEYLATLKIGEGENAVGLLEAVEKAMETMLATVVKTDAGDAYSLDGRALKITLFRTFYNFRNEKIAVTEGEYAPKLTIECDGLYGNEPTVVAEQDFTINDIDEYIAVIHIRNLDSMGDDPAYVVTVGEDSKRTSLVFGETLAENPYFTPDDEVVDGKPTGFKKAINGDGNFVMIFQGGCTAENYYLAVYNADAIEKDGGFANFSEMPLGTINLKNIKETYVDQNKPITREILNRLVANELDEKVIGKTLSLRFMIYGETVTDGVSSFTAMNPTVISEAIDFSLVEEDKYYTMPIKQEINNEIGAGGGSNLIVPMLTHALSDFINETLEANGINDVRLIPNVNSLEQNDPDGNLKQYIGIKLEVKATDDTVLHEEILPFELYGFDFNKMIKNWSLEYYKAHRDDNDNKTFEDIRMFVSYVVLEGNDRTAEVLKTYFPRSESRQLVPAAGVDADKFSTAVLTKQKLELKVEDMSGLASGTEKTGTWAYGQYELVKPNAASEYKEYDGLTVLIYEVPSEFDAGETVQNYDFIGKATPFVTYSFNAWGEMSWAEINAAINNAWFDMAKAGTTVASGTKSFVFLFQHKVNETGYDAGYFDSDAAYVTTEGAGTGDRTVISLKRDFTTPSGAQLKFQDSSYILLLRDNQPAGSGSIFDEQYGVQYIEVEFTFGTTTASAYLFVESGVVTMYQNADKSYDTEDPNPAAAPRPCAPVYDSSIYNGDNGFDNWVKYNYGIEDFDALQATFRTRIWHNGTAYIGTPASDEEDALQYGEWSDPVEYNA